MSRKDRLIDVKDSQRKVYDILNKKKRFMRRSRCSLGLSKKVQEGLDVVQDGLKEVKNDLKVCAILVNISDNDGPG